MGAHTPAPAAEFPAAGGIWRLSDSESRALGPVPLQEETGPVEAVREARPPAASRDYGSASYYVPLPILFYHGPRFSFSYGYPGYWPRYPFAPYPRHFSRAWRARPR